MKKAELLKHIEKELDKTGGEFKKPLVWYNKKWRYPMTGDDQRTCPMIDAMYKIEYNSGTIIFIPDQVNKYGQPGNRDRNKEED